MFFKQLFDKESSTYTYFLGNKENHEAIFIDPVAKHIEDYLDLIETHHFKLKYSLETHVHADHVTGSGLLRRRARTLTAVNQSCGASCADIQLRHGDSLSFGEVTIHVIGTSGHTPGSTSYLIGDRLFTGDSLLINGCGRTDFQGGNPCEQYDNITGRLFTLPEETLVYPGHDYTGRRVSCIGQERSINSRLSGKSREEFIEIMNNLNLPKPELIDIAVPANRMCGIPYEIERLHHG